MSLKRSISEVFYPEQVALDLRNQDPEAKRARIVDPNNVIDLSRSQSMESQSMELPTSLSSPKEKSTTEAPATPERKEIQPQCPSAPRKVHKEIDWDEFAKTHTPAEVLKAYSETHVIEDHVLETENVGNDVVVTGVKEVIPVPMIPFTQVEDDDPVDQDELMIEETPTQTVETQADPEETLKELLREHSNAKRLLFSHEQRGGLPQHCFDMMRNDVQRLDKEIERVQKQIAVETQVEATQPLETQSTATQVDDPEPIITAEQQVETTQQLETIVEEPEEEEEGKPKWTPRPFEEAYKGGEDLFFRYETRDPNMPQFTHSGVWNGLSSLELENMDMFMTNLREQFLSIPISKEHGITMAHFEDESVRIVGWAISDSMINF